MVNGSARLAGMPVNKSNGGVRSSKIKVERWFSDCCSASIRRRKFARSGFCWNTGSTLAASASPSPRMRVASATALLTVSDAWRSAADLIFCASASPSYCNSADEHLPLGGHALQKPPASRFPADSIFLKPRNSNFDAVIIRLQLRLDSLLDFIFNRVELQFLRDPRSQTRTSVCLPMTALLALRNMLSSMPLRRGHGAAGEFREKRRWRRKFSSRHRRHEQIVIVRRVVFR